MVFARREGGRGTECADMAGRGAFSTLRVQMWGGFLGGPPAISAHRTGQRRRAGAPAWLCSGSGDTGSHSVLLSGAGGFTGVTPVTKSGNPCLHFGVRALVSQRVLRVMQVRPQWSLEPHRVGICVGRQARLRVQHPVRPFRPAEEGGGGGAEASPAVLPRRFPGPFRVGHRLWGCLTDHPYCAAFQRSSVLFLAVRWFGGPRPCTAWISMCTGRGPEPFWS